MIERQRYIDSGIVHSVHPDMDNPKTVHATFREVGFVVLSADLFTDNGMAPVPDTVVRIEHDRLHVLAVLRAETVEL